MEFIVTLQKIGFGRLRYDYEPVSTESHLKVLGDSSLNPKPPKPKILNPETLNPYRSLIGTLKGTLIVPL